MLFIASSIIAFFFGFIVGYVFEDFFNPEDEEYISITNKGLQSLKEYEEKQNTPNDDA